MSDRWRSLLLRYSAALASIMLATVLRMWLDPVLGNRAPFSTYFVAIMFAAWYGGIGPSLVAMVLGALAVDYFFIEPRGSVYLYNRVAYDVEHEAAMGLYFPVSFVIALLSESLRTGRQRTEAASAEYESSDAKCYLCLLASSGEHGAADCSAGPSPATAYAVWGTAAVNWRSWIAVVHPQLSPPQPDVL